MSHKTATVGAANEISVPQPCGADHAFFADQMYNKKPVVRAMTLMNASGGQTAHCTLEEACQVCVLVE